MSTCGKLLSWRTTAKWRIYFSLKTVKTYFKDFENLMARKEKELSDKIREYDNLLLNVKEKIKY